MTKRKADLDLEQEIEIILCQNVYFCFGMQHGIVPFYQITKSELIKTIPSKNITYCIYTDCIQCEEKRRIEKDESIHIYLFLKQEDSKQKLRISYVDIQAFIAFIECDADKIFKFHLKCLKVKNLKINYFNLMWLFEYFLIDKNYTENLKIFLNEYNGKFNHSISALSAFEITKYKKQEKQCRNEFHENQLVPMLEIAYEDSVSFLLRLQYLTLHNYGDLIYQCEFMSKIYVSETLNIELELLKFLSHDKCIVAGGAALKLKCPQSKFTLKCDVDFFILKNDSQQETLQFFLFALEKTGRKIFIYDKNPTCFSAIGKYGTRRIQVIVSNHEKAENVIRDFDLPIVRAYYDGIMFFPTIGFLYDTIQNKVSLTTYYNIKANRLVNLSFKGFELSDEAQIFLKNTIGSWPPTKEFEDRFLYHIPYLVDDIPFEVQIANLYAQHRLVLYQKNEETKTNETNETIHSFGRYDLAHNIYCGKMNEYANFCKITVNEHSAAIPSREFIGNEKALFHDVRSDFVIKINHCKIKEIADDKNNTFMIEDIDDIGLEAYLSVLIPTELFQKFQEQQKMETKPIRQLIISKNVLANIIPSSQLFLNGLQIPKTSFLKEQVISARIFIRPLYFYEKKYKKETPPETSDIKLRWGITQLYTTN